MQTLYDLGFLHPIPAKFRNHTEVFWDSIQKSLDANKKGPSGKKRILSIIADEFSYDEIKKNLNVSIVVLIFFVIQISNLILFSLDYLIKYYL